MRNVVFEECVRVILRSLRAAEMIADGKIAAQPSDAAEARTAIEALGMLRIARHEGKLGMLDRDGNGDTEKRIEVALRVVKDLKRGIG